MALDPNPARRDFLTSRECSKMIGSLIGSLVGPLETADLRFVVLCATAIAGHARLDITTNPPAVCFDESGTRIVLPETGPANAAAAVVAIRALGGLAASIHEMASTEAAREAWQWWCLKDEAWERLAKLEPGRLFESVEDAMREAAEVLQKGDN